MNELKTVVVQGAEYYLSIKRGEVLIYAMMWMNLENMLCEID